ncbi:MAG TPA: diguanylate cyclase [Isosphaeraceae bacterium]|nr:diguanylate cyclase [Isosphaeraceae bacterium]
MSRLIQSLSGFQEQGIRMEDSRQRRHSSRRRPGSAGPTRESPAYQRTRPPKVGKRPRRPGILGRLAGWVRKWCRLPRPNEADLLSDFADRVARASTTAEVRTALADAARRMSRENSSEKGNGPGLNLPLRFGGKSLSSLKLAVDPNQWSARQRFRLESLAALAAAAEIALGTTRRPGSASVTDPVLDPATGLPSAAFLETHLTQALALAKRRKEPLVLMAVALEGLDRLRESDGAEFAGMALRLAARAVSSTLRASDLVVRLEGDRLAAVLPGAGKSDAIRVAEVLRRAVAEAGVASSVPTSLWASIGIAAYPDDAHSPQSLRTACEQALRQGEKSSRLAYSSRSGLDTGGTPR